jgi:large subunit ribosomal protein L22
MEVKATAKYLKVQPRKVRIVADEVRGLPAVHAAHKLRYHTSKGAKLLRKVLVSAMANAAENHQASPEALKIARIEVNEGPRQKRIQARAMGRANRILKKTSHITVVVEPYDAPAPVKPHGTKAKDRPKFAVVKAKPAKKVEEVVEMTEQADAPAAAEAAIEETATEQVLETTEATAEEKGDN